MASTARRPVPGDDVGDSASDFARREVDKGTRSQAWGGEEGRAWADRVEARLGEERG